MARKSVTEMSFRDIFPALVNKAQRKGRTKEEVLKVTAWLTGYTEDQIRSFEESDLSYGDFFSGAPAYHPNSERITGKICGIQVETIEDPLMKRIRQLDKLVDELTKGKEMEKILR